MAFDPREQGYKGGAFHNRFEHALSRTTPELHHVLCDKTGNAQPPYILLPPLDADDAYETGREFEFEITLIGQARRFAPAAIHAAEFMGWHGIGLNRGRFAILAADAMVPGRSTATLADDALAPAFTLAQAGGRWPASARTVTLHFDTMVRLSDSDDAPPTCYRLVKNLVRRINAICAYQPGTRPIPPSEEASLLAAAREATIAAHDLRWYDWPRVQWKTGRILKFGGFVGPVRYAGPVGSLLPLLSMGQWMHVGAKTAFGLGKIRVLELVQGPVELSANEAPDGLTQARADIRPRDALGRPFEPTSSRNGGRPRTPRCEASCQPTPRFRPGRLD